jgi:dolichol-phosphate mannosyltransferase
VNGDRFLIVLPTYNEAESLPRMVAALDRMRGSLPMAGDVLVVDDGSPDGTGRIADDLASRNPWLQVMHRDAKQGLGPAYLAGFAWALERDYSHILEMDCDLSHPVESLPAMLAASADADLVLGSRYVAGGGVAGWPLARRLISRGGCTYARVILGVGVHDLTGGFKCFRRWVLEHLDLSQVGAGGYAFQIELTYRTLRMGGRVVEVPITFTDRAYGESKMSRSIVLEAVREVPALRLRALRGRLVEGTAGEKPITLVP